MNFLFWLSWLQTMEPSLHRRLQRETEIKKERKKERKSVRPELWKG